MTKKTSRKHIQFIIQPFFFTSVNLPLSYYTVIFFVHSTIIGKRQQHAIDNLEVHLILSPCIYAYIILFFSLLVKTNSENEYPFYCFIRIINYSLFSLLPVSFRAKSPCGILVRANVSFDLRKITYFSFAIITLFYFQMNSRSVDLLYVF